MSEDVGGSSRFLTYDEILEKGINLETGEKPEAARPYVGALADDRKINLQPTPLYAAAFGHMLSAAPTRTGKGVGQIIPVLLSWQHSALILDVKGENYQKTAGFRARIGQTVQKFSPFEKSSDVFNPLMWIELDDPASAEEDAWYIADLICPSAEGGSADAAFFDSWNRRMAAALILYVRSAKLDGKPEIDEEAELSPAEKAAVRERSMSEVSRLANLDADGLRALLKRMRLSSYPLVKQVANSLARLTSGNDNRTGDNVLAALQRHLDIWAMSRVRRVTYVAGEGGEPGENGIDFRSLRSGKSSIYLVIPPDEIKNWQPVLRVMIGLAVRTLRKTQRQSRGRPPILAILDEFPQLGYMAPIEQSLLYMAGYGLLYWFFVQSLNDIERQYPKSYQTFLANTATQCFFGVSDKQTAEYVSELVGSTTVANESFSTGTSWGEHADSSDTSGGHESSHTDSRGTNTGGSSSNSVSYTSRALITPDEVRTLSAHSALVFMRHTKPILAQLIPYYGIPLYQKYSEIDPPEEIEWDS